MLKVDTNFMAKTLQPLLTELCINEEEKSTSLLKRRTNYIDSKKCDFNHALLDKVSTCLAQ